MKVSKFYYLFVILLVFTCNNEPVDTSVFVEDIEEEEEEEQKPVVS